MEAAISVFQSTHLSKSALARVTTVELKGGVLRVMCPDPRWARELARARDVVLTRLQQLLGPEAVVRLAIEGVPE